MAMSLMCYDLNSHSWGVLWATRFQQGGSSCHAPSTLHFCRCCPSHQRATSTMDWWNSVCKRKLSALKIFAKRRSQIEDNIAKVGVEHKAQLTAVNALDLVIVMDCTESMSPWISQAKSSILEIIGSVQRDHIKASVRIGFVAYRDFCDCEKRLEMYQLSEDVAGAQAFIATLRAFGGGDGPEDIPGGLAAALAMDFRPGAAKRLILVADAPCHGEEYSKWSSSGYEDEIDASPCIRNQMRKLKACGIDLTFIEINPRNTATMVAILQGEYDRAKSADDLDREFCTVSLSQSGDVVHFAREVASSASSSLSISKTRSVLVSSKKVVGAKKVESCGRLVISGAVSTLNDYGPSGGATVLPDIVEDGDDGDRDEDSDDEDDEDLEVFTPAPQYKRLNWHELDGMPTITAVRHSYHFRQGVPVDWAKLDLKHTTQETTIRLLPTCFAKGAMRSAHAMYDMNMGKRFVAKFYYGNAASSSRAAQSPLENDVQTQIVAKRLATEFSHLPQVQDGVGFIFTSLYEIQDPCAAGLTVNMGKFTAEPFIEGTYKKYNNNNGWINEKGVASLRDTAQAFSHFTWQKTFG